MFRPSRAKNSSCRCICGPDGFTCSVRLLTSSTHEAFILTGLGHSIDVPLAGFEQPVDPAECGASGRSFRCFKKNSPARKPQILPV